MSVIIKTSKVTALAEVVHGNGVVQVNVIPVPGGVGCFVVFPEGDDKAAMEAVKALLDSTDLEPDTNITALVPGCLVAGTGPRRRISVSFGNPTIRQEGEDG